MTKRSRPPQVGTIGSPALDEAPPHLPPRHKMVIAMTLDAP